MSLTWSAFYQKCNPLARKLRKNFFMEDFQNFKMYLKRFKQRTSINCRGLPPSLEFLSVAFRKNSWLQLFSKPAAPKSFTNSTNITYPLPGRNYSIMNIFQGIERNFLEPTLFRARVNPSAFRKSCATSRSLSVLLSSKSYWPERLLLKLTLGLWIPNKLDPKNSVLKNLYPEK